MTAAFFVAWQVATRRVHGLQGLRVVDSSIFPTIPNGNLNAPTLMVAERAADLILGKAPLVAQAVEVGLADDWQDKQRPRKPVRSLACAARG